MRNQGLIGLILLIIIGAIVLGFFGISLKAIFMKETVRENLEFVWHGIKYTWDNYLAGPANYAWNIFYNLLWRSFVENAERLKEGKWPTFIENRPKIIEPAQTPSE